MNRAQGLGLRAVAGAVVAAAVSLHASAFSQNAPSGPIIVKIIPPEEKSELSGLADVLLGSLGLTGVIVLGALLAGLLMGGVMFWIRSRSSG
jgi:hypothetical protein